MEPQVWIGIQVFLDLLMVALLVWFLRSHARRQASWEDHERAIQESKAILVEMREISQVLEANLEQKKALSSRILSQLDQGLKRAEESYLQMSRLLPQSGLSDRSLSDPAKNAERTRSSVHALLAKGLRREEVAQHLGISVGEIELLLKLHPAKDQP